jgi:hypothetical protein
MSFVAINLYVASQWVFNVVSVYFFIDSVRKRLDTPSNTRQFILRFSGEKCDNGSLTYSEEASRNITSTCTDSLIEEETRVPVEKLLKLHLVEWVAEEIKFREANYSLRTDFGTHIPHPSFIFGHSNH